MEFIGDGHRHRMVMIMIELNFFYLEFSSLRLHVDFSLSSENRMVGFVFFDL